MWEAACEYFEWCQDNPMQEGVLAKYRDRAEIESVPKMRAFTIEGLCLHLDCNKDYFTQFQASLKGKDDKVSKDFSRVINKIKQVIYVQKFEGAAAGLLNPNIIARDLGLVDKKEKEVKKVVKFVPKNKNTED